MMSRLSRSCSTMRNLSPLLSPQEVKNLASNPSNRDVKFFDASWYLDPKRDAKEEFLQNCIENSRFFDIDAISDTSSPLPHMLPSTTIFEDAMTNLGVTDRNTIVIVYGGKNCFSPARCWWMLRYFGHDNSHIMNGGIEGWKRSGFYTAPSVEALQTERGEHKRYIAAPQPQLLASWDKILRNDSTRNTIIDARSSGRFLGKEPEPRKGLRSGHIPGSINLPFSSILDSNDYSTFRESAEISKAFQNAGFRPESPDRVITTCGSGVTAAVLTFGLHLLGKPLKEIPVYDGSWSEWGSKKELPIAS